MLELKDICKTFNPNTINAKVALNHLNLTLNDGDFVTVIGGNGAGKSTMLNAIAGVFQVDSGTITIDGQDVTKLPEHKRAAFLGRVFQDPMMGTAPTMQIEENLALAARRGQIFLDLHGGGGAHHRVLKHPTDEFGPLVLRQAGHVHPVDDDGAAVHRKGAGHRIEHGGLAGAIAADDRAEVTVLQRQADAPEGLLFIDRPGVERLPDLLDLKHPDSLLFLLRHWRSRRAP